MNWCENNGVCIVMLPFLKPPWLFCFIHKKSGSRKREPLFFFLLIAERRFNFLSDFQPLAQYTGKGTEFYFVETSAVSCEVKFVNSIYRQF